MGVYKGTTPTVILTFPVNDVDFTLANNIYVTFKSNLKTVTKSGDDISITPNQIIVNLSQRDTLSFQLDEVEVQANWTYDLGQRHCSNIALLEVGRNLLMREVQ